MRMCKEIKNPEQVLLAIVGSMVVTVNSMTILSQYDSEPASSYATFEHVAKTALPILFALINLISLLSQTNPQSSRCNNIGPTLKSAPAGWMAATALDVLGYAGAASVAVPLACGQMIKDPKAPAWEISAAVAFIGGQLVGLSGLAAQTRTPLSASFGVLAGGCLLFGAGNSAWKANQASPTATALLNDAETGQRLPSVGYQSIS